MSAFDFHSLLATREGTYLEVHARADDDRWARMFVAVELRDGFVALCSARDCQVGLVPRMAKRVGSCANQVGVLVARLESKKQADALSRFRVGPSLVIREGRSQRRWALWGLQEPLRLDLATRGNRALAYSLGCVQRHGAEPERIFLPAPGSMLTLGQRRPVPVVCEFTAPRLYSPGDFRGVVRKPPEPNTDWKKAA